MLGWVFDNLSSFLVFDQLINCSIIPNNIAPLNKEHQNTEDLWTKSQNPIFGIYGLFLVLLNKLFSNYGSPYTPLSMSQSPPRYRICLQSQSMIYLRENMCN